LGERVSKGQLSAEQREQLGSLLKEMAGVMGGMGSMGTGQMGPSSMADVPKLMERMADIQKRMGEITVAPQ
jgi:hypothetical protein